MIYLCSDIQVSEHNFTSQHIPNRSLRLYSSSPQVFAKIQSSRLKAKTSLHKLLCVNETCESHPNSCHSRSRGSSGHSSNVPHKLRFRRFQGTKISIPPAVRQMQARALLSVPLKQNSSLAPSFVQMRHPLCLSHVHLFTLHL